MTLTFRYDLLKDTENFLKGFSSVNNKRPTKLQKEYLQQFYEVEEGTAKSFIETKGKETVEKLKDIKTRWQEIEAKVIEHLEKLFGIVLPEDITVYLSTNSRCTYNIEQGYFFVYAFSQNTNGIILHELMHFYTHYAFRQKLERKGVTFEHYNAIKESLTELINTDFRDLAPDYYDKGYPQHAEMRSQIRDLRQKGKSVSQIVDFLSML